VLCWVATVLVFVRVGGKAGLEMPHFGLSSAIGRSLDARSKMNEAAGVADSSGGKPGALSYAPKSKPVAFLVVDFVEKIDDVEL
jgi:hypothetical protein